MKIRVKTIFTFSFPVFVPLNHIFTLLVAVVQCCVSIKLVVSMAFLFQDNCRHGTDGQTDRQMDGFDVASIIN